MLTFIPKVDPINLTPDVLGSAMHNVLTDILEELESIVERIGKQIPNDEPFGIAHANWSMPLITKSEVIDYVQQIIDEINLRGTDNLENETIINDYIRRLDYLDANTIQNLWGNPPAALTVLFFTLEGLRRALAPALKNDPARQLSTDLRKSQAQARSIETRLSELAPRSENVGSLIERIEKAYEAADQLPLDLQTLSESRLKIANLESLSKSDHISIENMKKQCEDNLKTLNDMSTRSKDIVGQCENAYRAATSVGLAAAFSERSSSLSRSSWFWTSGLVVSLCAGGYFGSERIKALSDLLNRADASNASLFLGFVLSILSVGAPIWFSWLATKQIGHRFRLSEDYAYKASVSRAYEGFRRETARHDKEMEARLLASALSRLDEEPLRLIEPDTHGSPFHEIYSSNTIKSAFQIIPNFSDKIRQLAANALVASNAKKPLNSIDEDPE